jgi:hypothetical protein
LPNADPFASADEEEEPPLTLLLRSTLLCKAAAAANVVVVASGEERGDWLGEWIGDAEEDATIRAADRDKFALSSLLRMEEAITPTPEEVVETILEFETPIAEGRIRLDIAPVPLPLPLLEPLPLPLPEPFVAGITAAEPPTPADVARMRPFPAGVFSHPSVPPSSTSCACVCAYSDECCCCG